MTFFCISRDDQESSNILLQRACEELGIRFQYVTPSNFEFSENFVPKKGDLMYRVSDVFHADVMELEYYYLGNKVTSFYKDNNPSLVNLEEMDSFLLPLRGISTPKTFPFIPENREVLDKVISDLGGYPIIIKALGGSHGVGIMKISDAHGLYSITDYLKGKGGRFVLKQYIKTTSSARLIVLGGSVIDSIQYSAPEKDFRSNEGSVPNVSKAKFSENVQDLAVLAVNSLGLEFGGVDLLIKDDEYFITEVNFPCYFPRAELLTGTDIAKQMIQFLVAKSKKEFS